MDIAKHLNKNGTLISDPEVYFDFVEKVRELVGIENADEHYFILGIHFLLVSKEIEKQQKEMMDRFNELLTKENLTETELEDLQAFKVLIGMGIL